MPAFRDHDSVSCWYMAWIVRFGLLERGARCARRRHASDRPSRKQPAAGAPAVWADPTAGRRQILPRREAPRMIPKILHYVWVGGKPLPPASVTYIETWRKQNPDYEVKRWDESNIDFTLHYIAKAYSNERWANVSNLVRFLALYEFGGIYLDTDVEVLRSFDPLLGHSVFCGFQIEQRCEDWVNNAVLGAVPRHDFIGSAIKYIRTVYDGMELAHISSPRLMTKLLVRMGLSDYSDHAVRVGDVDIYGCRFFYPYNWKERDESRITPDTFTIHYLERSWLSYPTSGPLRERIRHRKYRARAALYRCFGRL
jgi:Glycosyltransferase sugar-binding region containing DXD motif